MIPHTIQFCLAVVSVLRPRVNCRNKMWKISTGCAKQAMIGDIKSYYNDLSCYVSRRWPTKAYCQLVPCVLNDSIIYCFFRFWLIFVFLLLQVSFTLGVIVICFSEWLLLRQPNYFTLFYYCLMPVLFVFRSVGKHWLPQIDHELSLCNEAASVRRAAALVPDIACCILIGHFPLAKQPSFYLG